MQTALKAFESLTAEQKGALSRTLEGFVDLLTGAEVSCTSMQSGSD